MVVRAKFTVSSITRTLNPGVSVKLTPLYDPTIPEDRRYAKSTPSGELTMYIDNPPAADFFEMGAHYYLDISKVG